ncbi:MAG: type II secretion system protein GspD [Gemmatimonadota bacterium]
MERRPNPRLARPPVLAALVVLAAALGTAGPVAAQVERVDDRVWFNFEDVDLPSAFESISGVLGINYVVSGDVGGTITMRTREGIPIERVPGVLDTVLQSHGLSLVRSGDLYVITRTDGAAAGGFAAGPRSIFVVHLRNADAVDVANLLVSLFGGEAGRFRRSERLEDRSLSNQLDELRLQPGEALRLPGREVVVQPAVPAPAAATIPAAPGELVGTTTFVPDERTNSLVIRTAPDNYPAIRETIERLDVRPLQVLIEVVIAEVALDEATQFGIDFAYFGREGDARVQISNANPGPQPPDSVGLLATVFDPGRVRAVLRALSADDRLNVLSTPRILASNNQEARILIGSEVPFVQVSSFGGVTNTVLQTVQFRDVGLELIVIPRINQDREVTLEILQQNSSLSSTSFGNIDAPLITSRQAETSLVVGDRRTVVLGGLIETQRRVRESGIPLLKDIPLLGNLFKSVEQGAMKTELIITLTPYIIASDAEAELLRQRAEREWELFQGDPDRFEARTPFPRPTPPPGVDDTLDVEAEIELTPAPREEIP